MSLYDILKRAIGLDSGSASSSSERPAMARIEIISTSEDVKRSS